MDNDFYLDLIQRDLLGTIRAEDKERLQSWRQSDTRHDELARTIYVAWEEGASYGDDLDIDVAGDYAQLRRKMKTTNKLSWISPPVWWALAASVLLLIAALSWLWPSANLSIHASIDGQQVVFEEGTTVSLKKGSILTYGRDYSKNRKIHLTGSGFFDVAKDSLHPFVILSPHLKTTVLGTQFYLADSDTLNQVQVQVLEGLVSVTILATDQQTLLSRGKRMAGSGPEIEIFDGLHTAIFGWYDRVLSFEADLLKDVVPQIANRYGLSIELNPNLRDCIYSATFTDEPPGLIMESIARVFGAKLIQTSEGYTIEGGQCN